MKWWLQETQEHQLKCEEILHRCFHCDANHGCDRDYGHDVCDHVVKTQYHGNESSYLYEHATLCVCASFLYAHVYDQYEILLHVCHDHDDHEYVLNDHDLYIYVLYVYALYACVPNVYVPYAQQL